MAFSRAETIALGVLVILFVVTTCACCFWRLCSVTCKTMLAKMPGNRRRRLNPAEKRVNKILSNESAREILKAHAVTAMNSAANQRQRGYSSQLSIDSVGSVPDLTDRVVRVSFAPTGDNNTNSSAPAPDTSSSSNQQDKEKDSISIGLYFVLLNYS